MKKFAPALTGLIITLVFILAASLPASASVLSYDREELPGGGVLIVKESRQLPMVTIEVSLRAGTRYESPAKAGLADDTIVIFASDHGDMMGERGLYYKKTFFEWAVRVPLIVWAPKRYKPARIGAPVSLVDMLATFHDLGGGKPDDILETDGTSLVELLEGGTLPPRMVAGEFLAEGVFEPTFMLRDDTYKLFYSETDPPLLFDLKDDQAELSNLANESAHQGKLSEMTAVASKLWNAQEIKDAIIKDQNRRRLIDRSHRIGRLLRLPSVHTGAAPGTAHHVQGPGRASGADH